MGSRFLMFWPTNGHVVKAKRRLSIGRDEFDLADVAVANKWAADDTRSVIRLAAAPQWTNESINGQGR